MSKRVLGKGLDALFSAGEPMEEPGNEMSLDKIVVKDNQPRKTFNQEALQEMAQSIEEHGVLQPLLVRPLDDGSYELVAGERRLRAAIMAGLKKVPVIVKDMAEAAAWEAALIENLQRENLNPMEEALAYQEMLDQYGYTQKEISNRIGKSRTHVANMVRLLRLPEVVRNMVTEGQLSAGHARAILSIKNEDQQIDLAKKILRQGMSVRDTEGAKTKRVRNRSRGTAAKDPHLMFVEQKFEELLDTKVRIIKQKSGGKIEVSFYDEEELGRIMAILGLEE